MSAAAMRPEPTEYAEFYKTYVDHVSENDIVDVLRRQLDELTTFLRAIGEDNASMRYAPDKWSIKEVIGHINDGERIFAYRIWRISRGDQTPLPGFDQNPYVEAANFDARSLDSLVDEFAHLRRANLLMLEAFTPEMWARVGTASEFQITVRALAFIMAGHIRHHESILNERYLTA